MIVKTSLRDQVKDHLQNMMITGQISFGERISLPQLADDLGISVTPIRESLTQLQQVNVVEAIPNRGFFLPKLNLKEALNIYPIISSMESLAITNSTYSKKDMEQLRKIVVKAENSSQPMEIAQLDLKFHALLIKNFDNEILTQIVSDLKIRVFLYELHYMQNSGLVDTSLGHHTDIINAIVEGNVKKAADIVVKNWEQSKIFITKQFNQNTKLK